jgi:hypothetical protein
VSRPTSACPCPAPPSSSSMSESARLPRPNCAIHNICKQ